MKMHKVDQNITEGEAKRSLSDVVRDRNYPVAHNYRKQAMPDKRLTFQA